MSRPQAAVSPRPDGDSQPTNAMLYLTLYDTRNCRPIADWQAQRHAPAAFATLPAPAARAADPVRGSGSGYAGNPTDAANAIDPRALLEPLSGFGLNTVSHPAVSRASTPTLGPRAPPSRHSPVPAPIASTSPLGNGHVNLVTPFSISTLGPGNTGQGYGQQGSDASQYPQYPQYAAAADYDPEDEPTYDYDHGYDQSYGHGYAAVAGYPIQYGQSGFTHDLAYTTANLGSYYSTPYEDAQSQQQQQQQQQQQYQQTLASYQAQPASINTPAAGVEVITGLVQRKVLIRQLHDQAKPQDVENLLRRHANVGMLRFKLNAADPKRGKKAHAMVTYDSHEAAMAAIQNITGRTIKGKAIEARLAAEKSSAYRGQGSDQQGQSQQASGSGSGSGAIVADTAPTADGASGVGGAQLYPDHDGGGEGYGDEPGADNDDQGRRPRRRGGNKGGSQGRPLVVDGSIKSAK